ncbi:TRAP transporter large permease [Mesobacillus maritimus]|uniref:TRAP transporter large permease n=1 Tax=Mesobacillus maritimus TaxID=1643336 RepID=UPI00384D6E20
MAINLLIALTILIVLLLIGVPVVFTFLASTVYLIFSLDYDPSFLVPYGFGELNAPVLLAIPLFIIAGSLMEKGGIGKVIIEWTEQFVGRIKGGLGVVAVVSCAIFGAVSGSALAALSTIGSIMFKRLDEQGYPRGYVAALISNSSILGLLIPPSGIMILYAWIGNQSVLASFLSTVIPGIIMIILLSIINLFYMRNKPLKMSDASVNMTLVQKTKRFGIKTYVAIPGLIMPIIVLGGIYGGIMTVTEAAAVAALYAIPVGFWVYKGLSVSNIKEVLIKAATTTGVIMVMLYAITILSRMYVMEDVPGIMTDLLFSVSENPLILLIMINVFMLIIGMLMDDISGVLLVTPILLPVVMNMGIDPIHFAAILAVNLGMGNVTPPTAPLLYFGGNLAKAPINEMLKPTFIILLFAWLPTLIITTYVPEVSLFLPQLILGK